MTRQQNLPPGDFNDKLIEMKAVNLIVTVIEKVFLFISKDKVKNHFYN